MGSCDSDAGRYRSAIYKIRQSNAGITGGEGGKRGICFAGVTQRRPPTPMPPPPPLPPPVCYFYSPSRNVCPSHPNGRPLKRPLCARLMASEPPSSASDAPSSALDAHPVCFLSQNNVPSRIAPYITNRFSPAALMNWGNRPFFFSFAIMHQGRLIACD